MPERMERERKKGRLGKIAKALFGATMFSVASVPDTQAEYTQDLPALRGFAMGEATIPRSELDMRTESVRASIIEDLRMRHKEVDVVLKYQKTVQRLLSFVNDVKHIEVIDPRKWSELSSAMNGDSLNDIDSLLEDILDGISAVSLPTWPRQNNPRLFEQYLRACVSDIEAMKSLTEKIDLFMSHDAEIQRRAVVHYAGLKPQLVVVKEQAQELQRRMNEEMGR